MSAERTLYQGERVQVVVEELLLGKVKVGFEKVVLNDSVAILAIKKDKVVILVKQYRPAIKVTTLDIPGGKVEEGEDELVAAQKELKEETGFEARKWTRLTRFPLHSGRLTCWKTIFLAEELIAGEQELEETEEIEVVEIPLEQIIDLVKKGDIFEPSLQMALFHYLLDKIV